MDTNERKYFDEKKGCTLNSTCACCTKPIWVRGGVQTHYHGKLYLHNTEEKIMSVVHEEHGMICEECWDMFEHGKAG